MRSRFEGGPVRSRVLARAVVVGSWFLVFWFQESFGDPGAGIWMEEGVPIPGGNFSPVLGAALIPDGFGDAKRGLEPGGLVGEGGAIILIEADPGGSQ